MNTTVALDIEVHEAVAESIGRGIFSGHDFSRLRR